MKSGNAQTVEFYDSPASFGDAVLRCLTLSPERKTTLQNAVQGKSWEAMVNGMDRLIQRQLPGE